ncbi:peroxidase family protein, partial [Salmonella sp. s51228]|uniref:peroxidase family protein n=1 Tax=Salmonella sp. s51228 TaxID=3159652 RepID=UPI00397F7DB5
MKLLFLISFILIYTGCTQAKPYTPEMANFPRDAATIDTHRDWEWESYDGWYNNLGHPDWGGADMQLYRRLVPEYSDGVYFPSGEERSNPILVSDQIMKGFTGQSSQAKNRRTAFFIFFGQQVVEEVLDAQRAGCSVEYLNLTVPLCHDLYDFDCNGYVAIPFPRSRYNKLTGQSPGVPREQMNEITPYFDGGLMYGVTKTWADALRALSEEYKGALAIIEGASFTDAATQLPAINNIGLPMANPSPPANHSLYTVNRFFRLGNPRGNENPFLMTWGIFWFRVHNFFASILRQVYATDARWTDE